MLEYRTQTVFIILFISITCYSQRTSIERFHLNESFTFLHEQQLIIDKIKLDFPEQSLEAKISEIAFNKKFNIAIPKINSEIKKLHGVNYDTFLIHLKQRLNENLKHKKMSKKNALSFMSAVKNSNKESIKSPILEILLSYQYQNNPVDEFLDNYVTTSSVRSYSNSSIIALSVKIPMSWKELDGDSPVMLKKFRSNFGTGKEIITIVSKKLVENDDKLSSSSKTIANSLKKKQYIEINSKVSSYQKRHTFQYDLLFENNVIQIECITYGNKDENFDLKLQKLSPLYELIIQSIELGKEREKNNLLSNKI